MAHSFEKLTAGDIMQRDVVTCAPQDSLREAMELMTENHVAGLPVMDSKSRCVGMISATDILSYEQEHSEFIEEANTDMAQHFDMDNQRWESVRITSFALEEFGDINVEEVMTRDLVTVARETPVTQVAAQMHEAKIHRILVVSEDNRLYGIISASDFVQLVAEA